MLTVKDVAEKLQIAAGTVYALIESGRLVAHRFGNGRGTIRVTEEDLNAYIESCRQGKSVEKRTRRPCLKHITV